MFRNRALTPLLVHALKTFPAIILSGARQTGKTTLLRHLFGKTHRYVLLDEPDKRLFANSDPRGFLDAHPAPVILDEIQNVPELLSFIKARIEVDRSPGRWILTGSQRFSLMKNISESLAGRAAVLCLNPYSLSEITGRKEKSQGFAHYLSELLIPSQSPKEASFSLGEWILTGGFPALWNKPAPQRTLWYSSYVQTYLNRDVRGNIREANLMDFQRFLVWLSARTGLELNMAVASRELGISIPTVKTWLSLLETSSLVFLLPPYHAHFGRRVIKSPKIYMMDTGLVCYLTGLQTPEHVLGSPMSGALFETAVVSNFKKKADIFAQAPNLYFWRVVSGMEVDMILDVAGVLTPVEIKLTSTITPHHIVHLNNWRALSKSQNPALVVSQFKEICPVGQNTINRPWWAL